MTSEERPTLEEFSERVERAQSARTGVEVIVDGGGMFAGQTIESPQRPPVAGGPRLTIHCSGPGGTLHVRSRPTLKDSLTRALRG